MQKTHPHMPNRRGDTEIEDVVREGRVAANLGEDPDVLSTLSRRGVPRAVIERIVVYRQCCRSSDKHGGK